MPVFSGEQENWYHLHPLEGYTDGSFTVADFESL